MIPSLSTSLSDEVEKDTKFQSSEAIEDPIPNEDIIAIGPVHDGDKEHKKSVKFKITIFLLCFVSVVVAMDSVIVAAALPAITVSLKGQSLEAFWIGTSYLLAQTVGSSEPFFTSQPKYSNILRWWFLCTGRSQTSCKSQHWICLFPP
jgi:hypothetical protein